jgi:hypothetical protein
MNMLALYYDIFYKDEFEEVFRDCYIFDHQTKEASSYHILKFDFSAISTKGDIDKNFSDYCNVELEGFLSKYKFDLEIDRGKPIHQNLQILFNYLNSMDVNLYIMIDEYDNFINNILMHSQVEYKKLVSSKDEAIYKEFFKLLKAGTGSNSSALKKMFITGVSPLAIYDVTSGSNIGTNITNDYIFHDAVGITRDELKKLSEDFDIAEKLDIDDWYNNYKFSRDVEDTVYNTDMILYYIKSLYLTNKAPENMVDLNLRIDYSKLRYLVYTDNRFSRVQK